MLLILAVIIQFSLISTSVHALEPVCAVEDPFAIPFGANTAETVFMWPGSESLLSGTYTVVAWSAPFGISEIATSSIAAGYSQSKFAITGIFNSSGFDLYGEDNEKFGISILPFRAVSVGLRVTRQSMRIEGFGNAEAWSADGGIVVRPSASLTISAAIEDVVNAELGKSHEPVDGRSRAGAVWDTGFIKLVAGISNVRRYGIAVEGGFIADLHDMLIIGAAAGSEPDKFMAMCKLRTGYMNISYRGYWHPELGMTHGFSISFGE